MRPDETDVNTVRSKLNDYNKTIVISLNIKHIVLISYSIHTVKGFLHIGII